MGVSPATARRSTLTRLTDGGAVAARPSRSTTTRVALARGDHFV